MSWLSEPPAMDGLDCLLTAYEYQPHGEPRVGTRQVYAAILDEVKQEASLRKKLARIPPTHFVWSDELANAYTRFIDLYMSREDAAAEGMGLRWNVAVGTYASLIGECPDFPGQGPSRRQERSFETAARHAEWQRRVDEKFHKLPKATHSHVSRLVARDLGPDADWQTIRRYTKRRSKP